MSNRRWALLFLGLIALCAAALLLMPRNGNLIGVWQDGELLYTIDLATVTEPYTLTLSYPEGETHIHVGSEGVYIASADCRSQTCVRHGPLKRGGTPIVCLPERIVIRYMRGESGVDAVIG